MINKDKEEDIKDATMIPGIIGVAQNLSKQFLGASSKPFTGLNEKSI